MPTEDDFDDAFADGFARALRGAAELAPEPVQHTLAVQAEQRGRRRRRRRRTAVGAGLAVLVLAGAGGFTALGGGPLGISGPATRPAPPRAEMSTRELITLVTDLLPKGTVKELNTDGPAKLSGHTTGANLLFDDGSGASIVEFSAEWTNLRPDSAAVCTDGFETPQDSCDRTVRPDGSVLVIDKLRNQNAKDGREWRVTWAAPDGRRVSFTEFNGQPATANRPEPPVADTARLTDLVTDPSWDRVFAALAPVTDAPKPGDSPRPAPAASGPSNAELLAKLVPLLPAGAEVGNQDPGHAALTVTYQGRTSMLQVGADPASKLGRDELATMDRESLTPLEVREKRPDGTLVVTNRFGHGKSATNPVLYWSAAVHYPDGSQLWLSEWNGENRYTTRPGDPALGVDQLKAIATAPAWRS
ncbi:hypothetical protein ACIRVF_18730 [Kitasatospora sp. NPDC101157]|uniref:hypothetical protein n=1 Tax=Kitasatospora sp. NPDC101157 TaxID=3364098 RepID=UPI00380EE1A4